MAEILKTTPVYSAWADQELVTPTGAAIISSWAERFVAFPEMSYEKIGCGAGGRDLEALPNILRIFYGEEQRLQPEKTAFQVEANIDDANPQLLAHFVEAALGMGALDAFLTPVVMKKGRLGTKLTLLAGRDKLDALIEAVFAETTSIGAPVFPRREADPGQGRQQGQGLRGGDRGQDRGSGPEGAQRPSRIRRLPQGRQKDRRARQDGLPESAPGASRTAKPKRSKE